MSQITRQPFSRVEPGDRLNISATEFNAMLSAAKAFAGGDVTGAVSDRGTLRDPCIVLIRNDSGGDRNQYDILGITGPAFDPVDRENSFLHSPQIVLTAATPSAASHRGRFCVLLEPVKKDGLARACILGTVIAKIDVGSADAGLTSADVSDADATCLRADPSGAAAILWRAAGTGKVWAVIRIGNAADPLWGTVAEDWTPGKSHIKVTIKGVDVYVSLLSIVGRVPVFCGLKTSDGVLIVPMSPQTDGDVTVVGLAIEYNQLPEAPDEEYKVIRYDKTNTKAIFDYPRLCDI